MSKNKYMLEFCEYSSKLLSKVHELNQRAKNSDCYTLNLSLIKKGLSLAKYYRSGQFRESGEPYVSHTIAVASMVADNIFRECTN